MSEGADEEDIRTSVELWPEGSGVNSVGCILMVLY